MAVVVGDSSLDSKLPFARARGLPVGPAGSPCSSFSASSLLEPLPAASRSATSPHGGISPPRVREGSAGPPTTPHHLTGKCVSCVARCSFADGTIYSRYSPYSNIFLPRASESQPRGGAAAVLLPPRPRDDLRALASFSPSSSPPCVSPR